MVASASVLVGASAYLGFAGANYGPLGQNAAPIYAEWMKGVADSTSLRNLAMPGSHDTMALYSIGDLAGACQTLSLTDQLNVGVRFLDIRLKLANDNLRAVHGIVDQRTNFQNIVNDVDKFLTAHPSEFLLVSIKEESASSGSSKSFDEAIKACLSDKWSKATNIPSSVGLARGRAFILSRYSGSTIGIPAYNGWDDNTTFTLPNDIYVQDQYKTDSDSKKAAVINCFEKAGHALKINFLSGYNPSSFPPSYAPSIANSINPWIDENISKYNDRNIVLYDFVDSTSMKAFFGGNK